MIPFIPDIQLSGRYTSNICRSKSRGIIIHVGHDRSIRRFSFDVGKKALSQGFEPSRIGSDMQRLRFVKPMFDLFTTLSKFLSLGSRLDKVVEKATVQPA